MTGERRVYALLALSARSGAATTCVGLLGLEDTGDEWVSEISYLPTSEGETDGGWPERIELALGARGLDPRTVAFWDETANGVLWGVTEIPESEVVSFESLSAALDALIEEIASNPDPDPGLIDWLAVRGR